MKQILQLTLEGYTKCELWPKYGKLTRSPNSTDEEMVSNLSSGAYSCVWTIFLNFVVFKYLD